MILDSLAFRVNNCFMNLSVISKRTKGEVIVIGAGIAGLAASLRLAHQGFSVTVLERHAAPGGKMRGLSSVAGPIDAGPTVLTMRPVFEDLFRSVGEQIEDHLTLVRQKILARHWWPDGSSLDLFDDYEASQEAIYEFAGLKAFGEFQEFFKRTQRLFTAFDAPMMRAAQPNQAEIIKSVVKKPSLISDMAPWHSLSKMLEKQFSDPRLAQLFGRYATYVGGSPYAAPSLLSLIWQAEANGVWAVKGGMHKLAKKLVELSENRGAIFHYNSHVSRILTEDEKVIGVTLENGENISADAVVFNGDPRALATGAMGPDCQKIAPQTLKDKRSFSARVWSFAAQVTGPDLIHHNVFFGQNSKSEFDDLAEGQMPVDPTIYICAQDRGQNAPYPKTERFEIILNAAPVYGAQTLEKEFETCRTRTFDTLGRFGLTFSPLPKEEALTTPADFASMFPASDGSLYGQSPHGLTAAFRRPRARTQIQGLYLAGGGAHPGAGVPMATLSARHAAEAIIKDLTSTSSSPQMDMHGGISTESIELRSARFQSSDS